jgi:hypothetical protein
VPGTNRPREFGWGLVIAVVGGLIVYLLTGAFTGSGGVHPSPPPTSSPSPTGRASPTPSHQPIPHPSTSQAPPTSPPRTSSSESSSVPDPTVTLGGQAGYPLLWAESFSIDQWGVVFQDSGPVQVAGSSYTYPNRILWNLSRLYLRLRRRQLLLCAIDHRGLRVDKHHRLHAGDRGRRGQRDSQRLGLVLVRQYLRLTRYTRTGRAPVARSTSCWYDSCGKVSQPILYPVSVP